MALGIRLLSVVMLTALSVLNSAVPSDAKIKCHGPFQIISGQLHAAPFCQDDYLATVARSYGMRVTARALRNDPSVKDTTCRFVGHDNRVRDICTGHIDERDNDRSDSPR